MIQNSSTLKIGAVVKIFTYTIGFLGFLSVVKHISLFYSLAFICFYLLSLYLEYKKNFLFRRWLLNALSLLVAAISFFRLATDDFVLVVAEALLILTGIKFLEDKKFRDHMQIYLLTIFLLAASALLSLDILFLLFLTSLIFLLAIALVLLTYYSQDTALELKTTTVLQIVSKSLLIPLLSIPMTISLFIILPRTNFPLLNFLNRGTVAKSGFTDTVALGGVSNIQEDATVIFRSHMEKVDEYSLYWRGIVLDYYGGKSWKAAPKGDTDSQKQIPVLYGRQVKQTIYLEPYENRYLFALDKPLAISLRNASRYNDLTFALQDNINRRIRYESVSILSDTLPDAAINKRGYLQLPEDNMQRIRGLVKNLSSDNNEATIKAIFQFLNKGDYSYSLRNLPLSDNPLEDFLFTHKYGNCEYFASAMAVMLRMAGIPSRVVGGYKGGYYNDIGGYYLVSQKNAHVWVEAYLDNKGWVRLDPTPAGIENFTSPNRQGIAFRIKLFFDTLQYHWNVLIINYDFDKQVSLFHKLQAGIKNPSIKLSMKKETVITYSIAIFALIFSSTLLYFLIFNRKTPEEKILGTFLKRLEKRGYKKSKSEGLEEFVERISDVRVRDRAYIFVREFEKSFYMDKKLSKEDIKKLNKITSLLFRNKN